MDTEKIVPTEQELKGFDLNDPAVIELIHHARDGDAADRSLTVVQALKKYKKAVFWAVLLSTSLIMEGYDIIIVRRFLRTPHHPFLRHHRIRALIANLD
jgi:SP family general alpha glucoside:H+ symporter-like MFS transporter